MIGGGLGLGRSLALPFEFVEGFGGAEDDADGRQAALGLIALGFFTPHFPAVDEAAFGGFERNGVGFHGVGCQLEAAEEAELVGGAGEALAGGMVAEIRIGGLTAGDEPEVDVLDDLRDAGIVEAVFVGDLELGDAGDFDLFVDFEIAVGRRFEGGGSGGGGGTGDERRGHGRVSESGDRGQDQGLMSRLVQDSCPVAKL